jgi:peptidoglycan biosynthesis protein MviN/MurJ (putative lipid II flippase)
MLTIMFFWMFWKFGGFILNVIVARLFGASVQAEAYFFACQAVMYTLIFSTGLKVLIPAFIPLFIEQQSEKGEEQAWAFANTVGHLLLAAAIAVAVVLWIGARPITDTLVRGFSPEAREIGVRLLRIVLPGALVLMGSWLFVAILNSYKHFSVGPLADAVQKLTWAAALFVTYRFLDLGVYAVALGFLVGCAGQLGVFLWGLWRWRGHYRPGLPLVGGRRVLIELGWLAAFGVATAGAVWVVTRTAGGKGRDIAAFTAVMAGATAYTLVMWHRARARVSPMARFVALAAPLLMSALFARYRDFVTFYFQSFTMEGVYADIEYAKKLAMVPPVAISYALSIAMFPYMCEMAARRERRALSGLVDRTVRMLGLAFVPLTVMTVILAEPVVRLVYDQGGLHPLHVFYMALSLQILISALLFYGIENVVMQSFFSIQSMWWPTLMGICATGVQIAILAVPVYALGLNAPSQIYVAVAVAFPLSRIFKNLVLLAVLQRKIGVFRLGTWVRYLVKLAVVTAAAGGATWGGWALMQRVAPLAPHRERQVVVDAFEPDVSTWFSRNARRIWVERGASGERVLVWAYPRGRRARSELTRGLEGLRRCEVSAVRLRTGSKEAVDTLAVGLVDRQGRRHWARETFRLAARGEGLQALEARFEAPVELPGRLVLADRSAKGPARPLERENVLRLGAIVLLDPESDAVWLEDFDGGAWSLDGGGGRARVADFGAEPRAPGLALPPEVQSARRGLEALDIVGCTHLRLKLFVPAVPAGPLRLTLVEADGRRRTAEYRPEAAGWNRVRLALSEFRGPAAMGAPGPARPTSLELALPKHDGAWAVREIVFYRPAKISYEGVKFISCAVPSALGFATLLLVTWLLRMEELRAVVAWIRQRGWRKRRIEEVEAGESPNVE